MLLSFCCSSSSIQTFSVRICIFSSLLHILRTCSIESATLPSTKLYLNAIVCKCTFVKIDHYWFCLFCNWFQCCSHFFFSFPFSIDNFIDSKLKPSATILNHANRIRRIYSSAQYSYPFFSRQRHQLWMVGCDGLFCTPSGKYKWAQHQLLYSQWNLSLPIVGKV